MQSSNMNQSDAVLGSVDDIGVWPLRVVPFDLGRELDSADLNSIRREADRFGWKCLEIKPYMKTLSKSLVARYRIDGLIELYLYDYGIGVFLFIDEYGSYSPEHWAIACCDDRRTSHKALLSGTHPMSAKMTAVIHSVRSSVWRNKGARHSLGGLRPTSSNEWNPNSSGAYGLLYVLSVLWIMIPDNVERKSLIRDLQITLQPSLASEEDSPFFGIDEKPSVAALYSKDALVEAAKWHESADPVDLFGCSVYSSWAGVCVLPSDHYSNKSLDLLQVIEANLQSSWMLAYCMRESLESCRGTLHQAGIAECLGEWRVVYSDLLSVGDASAPVYLKELSDQLIKTSCLSDQAEAVERSADSISHYISAKRADQHRRADALSETMLFILALTELPATLYSFVSGEYGPWAGPFLAIMFAFTIVFIFVLKSREE